MDAGHAGIAIAGDNCPHFSTKVLSNAWVLLTSEQLARLPFRTNPTHPLITITDPHTVLPRTTDVIESLCRPADKSRFFLQAKILYCG
jgi:hypothetical protein